MEYTKDLLINVVDRENGVEDRSISVQVVFDACTLWIKENTLESNKSLQQWLLICPDLASMKNSNQTGFTLLMYAASTGNPGAAKLIVEITTDINSVDDNFQQTALHHAVFAKHPEIVDLLIKAGANVNIQDKHKQTPLWMASSNGQLGILKKIAAVNGAELETENESGWTPLHIATINGHMHNVEHLISLGVVIDRQGHEEKTALHIATRQAPDVAKFLVNHGADADIKDIYGQTSLLLAVLSENIELVELMIEKNANPYLIKEGIDTVFDTALDKKNPHLLKVLWNKKNTRNLSQAISDNDSEKTEHLLLENQFTEEELRVFFLSSVNYRKFAIASILFEHTNGLQSKYEEFRSPEQDLKIDAENGVSRAELNTEIFELYRKQYNDELVFEGTPFEDKSESILDAFAQISELLCDIPTCTELLKPIDDELRDLLPQLGDIKSEKNIVIKGLLWPDAAPENYQPLDKKGALRRILRSYLQKHNIETQNELYNFAGFVKTKIANALVRKGALFKEQFLIGNALTHGLYSHDTEWYLIGRGIDTGRIVLPDGLVLLDILQASVDVQTKNKKPAWTLLVDNVSPVPYSKNGEKERIYNERYNPFFSRTPSRYRLSSVIELSSFLYTTSKLPHLRGYLLDSLYKSIRKIQSAMKSEFPDAQQINHKHIMAGQAIGFWAFNRFRIGLSNANVGEYYEKSAKNQGKLNPETGIVTKPIPTHWTTP